MRTGKEAAAFRSTGETVGEIKNEAAAALRIGKAMRTGFREAWDRLGTVLALSLTWTLLLMLALALGRLTPVSVLPLLRTFLAGSIAALILSAPTAGIFHVAYLACTHDEFGYGDLWRNAKRLFAPATKLGFVHLAVITLFGANLWFYLNVRGVFGGAVALLCLYLYLFWLMQSLYHFPLLVAQEAGIFDEPERKAKRGAFAVLRRAFFLTLGAPGFTLVLLLTVLPLTVLLFIAAVPFVLLWAGGLAMFLTPPTRALLTRFGVLTLPALEPIVPDEKFRIADKK